MKKNYEGGGGPQQHWGDNHDSLYVMFLIIAMHKKCTHSELFWSVFSRIRTEYGETRSISPYSVQMWESTDQNNSEYGHFSRSVKVTKRTSLNWRIKRIRAPWDNHCVKKVSTWSFFLIRFSCIRTEYKDFLCEFPYSDRVRWDTGQIKLGICTLFSLWMLLLSLITLLFYLNVIWVWFCLL